MKDCIFCKIVKGDLPAHVVFEDDTTIAFLDIYPAVPGYTIVIPKQHYQYVWDISPEKYDLLMKNVRLIARRLQQYFAGSLAGMQVEGLEVPHAHVKLLPFSSSEEFLARADMSKQPHHEELALLAAKLRNSDNA